MPEPARIRRFQESSNPLDRHGARAIRLLVTRLGQDAPAAGSLSNGGPIQEPIPWPQRSAGMPARVEQGSRRLKSLLAPLAICRKPLVTAALCFLAGMVFFWFARGVWGCGWRPFGGRVFTCDEVMAARRNARYATQSLGSFLGDSPQGYGWRQYLRFDELQAELGDEYAPPSARSDPKLVADVVDRLSDRYPGLELQQFTRLRSALSAYLKMLDTSESLPERPAPPEPRTAVMPQQRYRY